MPSDILNSSSSVAEPLLSSVQSPAVNPRQILAADALVPLNQRSNLAGGLRLAGHLAVMGLSGYLWGTGPGWLALPSLLIYGATLALMFCAMHECAHRTAFESQGLNDSVAWLAGLLSFYNSTFYRLYHKWHHRYTQIPGKDPELGDPKPTTLGNYIWQLSGIPWWLGKFKGHGQVALGQLEGCFYLPESSHAKVIRSTQLQLAVYGLLVLASITFGQPWFLAKYWLLPLAVGQPLLRFVLFAEHQGCTHDDNPLTNTRTTLTLWPLRFLMWNMPYHTEHHLYPSIPFHALPQAHGQLREHFAHIEPGYVAVGQQMVAGFK
ncbi:MAG: fatty acid desaturase [Cyanobacteria bacterium]|nr:fatty acid desaturase [Cyanobacteriota bacterium]MDA0864986.1 fatty acid desaturase [Cyanobacteriota bacterium]